MCEKEKHFYAKYAGNCYGFARKIHRDNAVKAYGFKKLSANSAAREFGYTDSCSRYVIDCEYVPAETEKAIAFVRRITGNE